MDDIYLWIVKLGKIVVVGGEGGRKRGWKLGVCVVNLVNCEGRMFRWNFKLVL